MKGLSDCHLLVPCVIPVDNQNDRGSYTCSVLVVCIELSVRMKGEYHVWEGWYSRDCIDVFILNKMYPAH